MRSMWLAGMVALGAVFLGNVGSVRADAVADGESHRRQRNDRCLRGHLENPDDLGSESHLHAAIDVGGRAYYQGPLPNRLYDHWMRSFCQNAGVTLHLRVLRGTNRHHILEAAFKALGLALRDALVDSGTVFSTKGAVALEVK